MDKCISLHKNLLSGIFFLGIACSVLGETPENEDALETGVKYQVDNSTSVQQMYRDAVVNVSHNIPGVQTTPLPKSLDIQISTIISSPALQPEFEYRNGTQDDENSSQALKEMNSSSFEINTTFNFSELEYQDNEEHTRMFTTRVRGKTDQDQVDFKDTHHTESISYDSVGSHHDTESSSIAAALSTEFSSHLLNTTNTSQIQDVNQVITTVAPEVHYTTDLDINEAPYNRVIFDQNLELMMNSTDKSLIAGNFLDFGGTDENNLALDTDGNHTSFTTGISHSFTSTLSSDNKQTALDIDGSYTAATDVVDEVTIANATYLAEHYVTMAAEAVFGESNILSRDETDEDVLTVTSRTGQDTSTKADLNTTVMDVTNDLLTKSTTISEATETYTNLGSHTKSGSSLGYEMLQTSNSSGSENPWRSSEDIRGNTISDEQDERNCESQQGCQAKSTESEHLLDILVMSPIYTSTEYHTTESDETVIQVHGTPSSEEQIYEKVNHVEVTTTEIYTVLPVFVGENSYMNHHKRSTSITSGTNPEHHSSFSTITTGTGSEIVSTNSDVEVLAFSDDGEQRVSNSSSISSSDYHHNLMNYSSFSTNVREDAERVESLSEDQQPGDRIVTGAGGTQQQTTSFVDAQLSNLGAASSSVDINPTLSAIIFLNEHSAHKNAPSTTDTVLQVTTALRISYDSHTSPFESSYSDALDSDFNYITATENARMTASATTETVNNLSVPAENNTETSTEQNTRSAEFYDMAHSSNNEQNNLNNPYTASIPYKLTSESQMLPSTETSFHESLPTEVSTKVMDISLQISTQSPLPNISEVLLSSSHFSLPELSTESSVPFDYSTHRSDRALSQSTESTMLERYSDILSLPSNQSLRSTGLHNSTLQDIVTVSLKEFDSSTTRIQASSDSAITRTPAGTSPTEETQSSSSGSNEESSFPAPSTGKLVATEYDEFSETNVLSSSFQQEHKVPVFSSIPTETTSTVQMSDSDDNFSKEMDYSAVTTHMTYTESDRVILPTDFNGPSEVSEDSSTPQVLLDGSKSTMEYSYLTDSSEGTPSSHSTKDIHFSQNHSIPDALQKSVWSRVESMIYMVSDNVTNTFEMTDVSYSVNDFPVSSTISEESTDTTSSQSSTESADTTSSLSFTESAAINSSLSSTESADATSSLSFRGSADITSSLSFTESADTTSSQSFTESADITSSLGSTETPLTISLSSTETSLTSSLSATETPLISSLSFTETLLPRSSETLTSMVHLTSDATDTSMATSARDKLKGSTFPQDYSSHSTHEERMESESPEVSTTEQTTYKYTQDFLTTQSKEFIIQKEFESLTVGEMNNTISVVFKIAQDVQQQIDSYTRRFSKWMVKMLLAEIKEHKTKTSSSDVSDFQGKSNHSPVRIELIYILPSPYIFSEDLIFTFFALISPDNDTIPLSKVIDALLLDTEGMQNYMNLNLSYFIRGQYLMPNDMYGLSFNQVWQKYGILLLTVSMLLLLIVVILIAAVIYVRCKSRRSVAYISDKDRLHHDLHDSTEIGDLNRGSVILEDELYEKDTSLVNGNHVLTIGDDEGWLVPINDIPMEDQDAPDVQDTKL